MIQHHEWSGPKHAATQPSRWSRRIAVGALIGFGLLAPLAVATPASAAPSSVTVVRGNTLSGLAQRWCGSASRYVNLAAGNGISNPNLIFVGQKIRLTCSAPARTTGNTASRSTTRTTSVPASGWVNPLPGAPCVSGWGAARVGHSHKGVDLARGRGTPIHAAHSGTVTVVKYQAGGAGWYVMLNHGTNQTVYMHMRERTFLNVGAKVQVGQTIGYVGATGDATRGGVSYYHLHFEVHRGAWNQINPSPFMRSVGAPVGC